MFLVHEKVVTPAQKLVEFVLVEMFVLRIDDMSRNHSAPPIILWGIVAAVLMDVTCPIGQLTQLRMDQAPPHGLNDGLRGRGDTKGFASPRRMPFDGTLGQAENLGRFR